MPSLSLVPLSAAPTHPLTGNVITIQAFIGCREGCGFFVFWTPLIPSSRRCLIQDKRAAADLSIFQNLVFNSLKKELLMQELNTLKVLNVIWDLDSSLEIFREVFSPLSLGTSFAFLHIPQVPVISGNADLKAHIRLDWLITCVVMINLPNLSLLWTFN